MRSCATSNGMPLCRLIHESLRPDQQKPTRSFVLDPSSLAHSAINYVLAEIYPKFCGILSKVNPSTAGMLIIGIQ